jgi:hypothetical protein
LVIPNFFRILVVIYNKVMASVYLKVELVVVFKNTSRANAKIRMKVFKNKTIDDLIESLINPKKKMLGIPATAEFLQIGCGGKFKTEWKKKYKI